MHQCNVLNIFINIFTRALIVLHRQQLRYTQFLDDFDSCDCGSRLRCSKWEFTGQIFPLILAIWFSWAPLSCLLGYLYDSVFLFGFSHFHSTWESSFLEFVGVVRSPASAYTPFVLSLPDWAAIFSAYDSPRVVSHG